MSGIKGVVDFYPQINLVSRGQSIGCIAKSFKGDVQEANS